MSDRNKKNLINFENNEHLENDSNDEEIPKLVFKDFIEKENILVKENVKNERENRFVDDINNTLKLLDIDQNDNIIEWDETYFRNDPEYKEINGYVVGEKLGEGVFALVKEFVHKNTCKRFAAKIMNKKSITKRGTNFVENIKIEINLVRKLKHKNVIKIMDSFDDKTNYYLILEYCYAVLEEYLCGEPRKQLPKSQSHYYFCQLIEGLEYLHSIGIIHRDIKPANLLINTSNQIKITDFGVCFILDKFEDSDQLTSVEGTPYYTPPEIFREDIQTYSGTKYDIWSTGITLYEMITGGNPFDDDGPNSFFDNVVKKDIVYPEQISNDKQLMHLLNEIFIKDFNKRITIERIKKHPWFILKRSHNDFRTLPPKESGDLYRGLTVLPHIQYHFNPTVIKDVEQPVSKQEFEESSDRTPSIRSLRSESKKSFVNQRKISPLRRIARLSLGIDRKVSTESTKSNNL